MKAGNYRGLWDPHLNVFINYTEKYWLENNITAAFVKTIMNLKVNDQRDFFHKVLGFDLPEGEYKIVDYLQEKPEEKIIKSFSEDKRFIFAFNPEGKPWGYPGLDTKDKGVLIPEFKAKLKKDYPSMEEKEINDCAKKMYEEIEKERKDTGSIPDGWFLIYQDNCPLFLIALENKKYLLNPYQINNHIEKSLFRLNNKCKPVYSSYKKICDAISNYNDFLSKQFIEYMVILNEYSINNFESLFLSDEKIRRRICFGMCKTILKNTFKTIQDSQIDDRHWNTKRAKVDGNYLSEINLTLNDNVELSLCFGSKQNKGYRMIKDINLELLNIQNDHLQINNNFHLKYHRGRNINKSYLGSADKWESNDCLNYLKNNLHLIKLRDYKEAIDLYNKLYIDTKITKEKYEQIKELIESKSKNNRYEVIPEIEFKLFYAYEEIAKLGLDGFSSKLREDCEPIFRLMNQSMF